MIKPVDCFLAVFLTFLSSFTFFHFFKDSIDQYFFITVFILIALYTVVGIARDQSEYWHRPWNKVFPKALFKWLFWGFWIALATWVSGYHSFYKEAFPHVKAVFEFYSWAYLIFGLPYHLLSEKLRYNPNNFLADPYLRVFSLLRKLFSRRWKSFRFQISRGSTRKFFLSSLFRFHFVSIMLEGIYHVHFEFLDGIRDLSSGVTLSGIIATLTALAWAIDNNNAAIGYFWESNFTKTRFKKIDPFAIHWFFTLMCYHPFNRFAGTFLLSPVENAAGLVLDAAWFKTVTDSLLLFFTAGYALSGTTLAFSWSNLTYKQIQTRGFYAVIRHPGTFFKLGIFGTMIFRTQSGLSWAGLFGYMIWITVYFIRTVCEERFLKTQPEYAEYMKQTKYRIIPWVY